MVPGNVPGVSMWIYFQGLETLLEVPEGRRISEPERLRRPPTRTAGTGMAKALERFDEISS